MSWLDKLLPPKIQQTDPSTRKGIPEGLWVKCPACECSCKAPPPPKRAESCTAKSISTLNRVAEAMRGEA